MISRREFLTTAAATGAAFTIVPRHVLGRGYTPPSDKLNIAGVGVGGMGKINMLNLTLGNNIVALCDVDWDYAGMAWDQTRDGTVVTSAGATLRMNLFGFAIGQLDYVRPFQRPGVGWMVRLSLTQGF